MPFPLSELDLVVRTQWSDLLEVIICCSPATRCPFATASGFRLDPASLMHGCAALVSGVLVAAVERKSCGECTTRTHSLENACSPRPNLHWKPTYACAALNQEDALLITLSATFPDGVLALGISHVPALGISHLPRKACD